MAGHPANYYRPTAGPLAGQVVYVSKAQHPGYTRAQVLKGLNQGTARSLAVANTQRPAASLRPQPKPAAPVAAASASAQSALAPWQQANLALPRVTNGTFGHFATVQHSPRDFRVIDTRTGSTVVLRNSSSFVTAKGAINLAQKANHREVFQQQQKARAQQQANKPRVGAAAYGRLQALEQQAKSRRDTLENRFNMLTYGTSPVHSYSGGMLQSLKRSLTPAEQVQQRKISHALQRATQQWQRRYADVHSVQP